MVEAAVEAGGVWQSECKPVIVPRDNDLRFDAHTNERPPVARPGWASIACASSGNVEMLIDDQAPKLPPATALRTLARIGGFLHPYRARVVVAALALVVAAAATLAIGQGLKVVVDRGFAAGNAGELDRGLALMLGVVVVMAAATYVRFYTVSWLGERVTADLRRKVFAHLLALSPGFYETTRTGEVISRLTSDTTMLETVIGSSVSMAARNLLLLAGGFVMLALTSAKLTVLVLVGVPVVVLPILLSRATQDRVGEVGAYLDEAIHEIRTVQAYGHEDVDRERFAARVEAVFATARQRVRSCSSSARSASSSGSAGATWWPAGCRRARSRRSSSTR